VSTSEPFDNIEKAERHEKALAAGKPVTYSFTAPEHGVYEIVVNGEENEYDIALRVEALKGTSKLVSVSPPGVVYKNLNVWAGTKRIKDALIRFKVENSWLTSNNIASGNVKMVLWENGKWVQLDTTQITKDNSFTYYEAKTDGFSVFAIVGLKEGEVVPTETAKPTPVTTPAGEKTPVTEATEKESPGFGAVSIISAMVLMVALRMRKRERR
ncbi:MAG: PGF-pre-PGF domain-containing protein, partial [Candidatus Methanoperedens sp.]